MTFNPMSLPVFDDPPLVGGREDVPRTAVYQNASEGIIPDLDVHRYDHGASRDHSQTGRDPLRTIPAHNSHVVPTLHTNPAQTTREKPHPPGELAIRPTLYSFLTKSHESSGLPPRAESPSITDPNVPNPPVTHLTSHPVNVFLTL